MDVSTSVTIGSLILLNKFNCMKYTFFIKDKSVNLLKIVLVIIISLYMYHYLTNLSDWYFVDNINLIFHEAGHIVFIFFGDFIRTLGGTLMQILIPTIFSFYFYKNEDYFSASLLLFWLSQNLFNISIYAGDAIRMELPLLGGDNVYHDWNHLLSYVNLLKYTDHISSFFYIAGIIIFILAVVYSIRSSISDRIVE